MDWIKAWLSYLQIIISFGVFKIKIAKLQVYNPIKDGWMTVTNEAGRTGKIPSSYIEKVNP